MKRICKGLVSLLVLFAAAVQLCLPAFALTPPPGITAQSACIYEPSTGTAVYEKDADKQVPVGFLAKAVTAMVALESLELSDTATVTAEYTRGVNALSAMNYSIGEQVRVEDLLYAVFVQSSDEAANILAAAAGDGVDPFIALMNNRAAHLGAEDTYFTNTHGVNDGLSHTTARDAAVILAAFAQNETLMSVADTTFYRAPATDMFGEREMYSTNSLITDTSEQYNSLCRGIKNDYDIDFGYSLSTCATYDDTSFIGVLFGASKSERNEALSYPEMSALINWAFENYRSVELVTEGQPCTEIALNMCRTSDRMVLAAEKGFSWLLPEGADGSAVTMEFDVPAEIDAPVTRGDKVGSLRLIYEGKEIGSVTLTASTDAALDSGLYYTARLAAFFRSPVVRGVAVVLVLVIILYIVFIVRLNKQRKKQYRSVNTKKYGK